MPPKACQAAGICGDDSTLYLLGRSLSLTLAVEKGPLRRLGRGVATTDMKISGTWWESGSDEKGRADGFTLETR